MLKKKKIQGLLSKMVRQTLFRTITTWMGTTGMGFCYGGSRLGSLLHAAGQVGIYRPELEGESGDGKLLRGNRRAWELLAKLTGQDSCPRQARWSE